MYDSQQRPLLSFRLLGPVQAWYRGAELGLGSAQQRTTLAMLLLREGAVVPMDDLVGGMWGDEPPRSAVTTIRTYVSRLRASFVDAGVADAARLASVGGGYLLDTEPEALDLSCFRRRCAQGAEAARAGDWSTAAGHLQAATAMSKGQPLAGALGPYVESQRTRLHQLVTAAQVDLFDAQIHLGQHREILPELATMAAAHPLWEDVQALFMTALYGNGRVAEALNHYRTARRTLVDDLGIEPGLSMRDVHRRILAGDPSLVSAPPSGSVPYSNVPSSFVPSRLRQSRSPWGPRRHRVRVS